MMMQKTKSALTLSNRNNNRRMMLTNRASNSFNCKVNNETDMHDFTFLFMIIAFSFTASRLWQTVKVRRNVYLLRRERNWFLFLTIVFKVAAKPSLFGFPNTKKKILFDNSKVFVFLWTFSHQFRRCWHSELQYTSSQRTGESVRMKARYLPGDLSHHWSVSSHSAWSDGRERIQVRGMLR